MRKKYDIVIYLSLFAALVCLGLGLYDYNSNAIKVEDVAIEEDETEDFKNLNKSELIEEYLNSNENNYVDVSTWGEFEIENISFMRKITDDYFAYQVTIELTDNNSVIPDGMNVTSYGDSFKKVSFVVNIAKRDDVYMVKSIEF